MSDEPVTVERAGERLAYHLLTEAYRDLASVLLSADAKAARSLFHAVEARTADALRAVVAERRDGPASLRIARAVGGQLNELFEGAHGHTGIPASRRVA
ncbi:hypothetical protein [Methylobacterium nonmethylotrophicum]|uniref:Uncharacterized protein n=1 Tax=Methylobacterium nonmethylotrophicum TaxID=1141884 RepID=A0A4Z0NKV0_9HYPH|nr:hypothetical protein [Methylobacterium nonmethylotrophicum]TGD96138.1 hypothetical protein EU555_24560 [Methylobacterium nonmethylotrophicum]